MTKSKRESLGAGGTPAAELRLVGMCLLWASCVGVGTLLLKSDLLPTEGPIPWAVATSPAAVAVLLIIEYARFLRAADELQRAIQLRAMTLGFGGAFFVMTGYPLFETLGAPALDLDYILAAMVVLYVVGVLMGERRFR